MATKAAGNQNVEVEDYYDKIHRTTWTRRTAGFLAGGTLGGAYGAVVGTVAAFLPFILSAGAVALPSVAVVATSVALFTSIMAVMGLALGADVAANSASIAAGMAEKEKREKAKGVGQEKEAAIDRPPPHEEKSSGIYSWKAGIIMAPLFAAFGALIAGNPLTASTVASLSFSGGAFVPQSAAAVAASTILFGVAGALMAFKNSMFTNKLSNFYMGVLTGRVADKLLGKSPVEVEKEKDIPSPEVAAPQPEAARRLFAPAEKKLLLQARLERHETSETVIQR